MKQQVKKIISYILIFAVSAAALLWAGSKFVHLGNVEFTDNATVRRHIVPVNSRVQGYIEEIRFTEYGKVRKGDTLVILDGSDLKLNVLRAEADYRNAVAGLAVAEKSVRSAEAAVAVSTAASEEARILMENASVDLARYSGLLAEDAVTRQLYDKAKTDYEARKAHYEMLSRQNDAAATAVEVSRRRLSQAEAAAEMSKALLETAELNLSYSVIVAPCDGYASRKELQEGQLIHPGRTLLDIVDSEEVWVAANYKETQLCHIAPGSRVRIKVDAFPDTEFKGEVSSISTATGSSLSLIPQDNSAGNFVKVRQRVPVRIEFTGDNRPEDIARLGAGMNVECCVEY